jgi:uncharacterized caspase-like protein
MGAMRKAFPKSVVLLAALLAGAIALSPAASEPRKTVSASAPRLALVIGNANYTKLGRLANPANDARLVAEKLRQLGFDVTQKADRDLKGMSDDVEQFARSIKERGKDTVSVLYYAGHGLESDGANYLVPVSADLKRKSDVAPQSLSVRRIADKLSSAGNGLNILILDACRDNPFPESIAPRGVTGLVPMGAVYGVFIASATGSGKTALDGDDGHSPYTSALAEAITAPGEKLEDVFKSVRRQVRLSTGEQQIPWESTSLELDFYFVPPAPPPSPAAQLLAAAKETQNPALFDLLLERFADSPEAPEARSALATLRAGDAKETIPAAASSAAIVLARAKSLKTPEAYDLVASLFPGTPEAEEARGAASRLREAIVLDTAGPTYEGHELVQHIQEQLIRLDCMPNEAGGNFDPPTISGLRRASLLTDERYLWYRPTMAALRALKKLETADGCGREKPVAAPKCLHVNNEDFCR